ncbi:MAG: phage major capsid protein [Clostridia bacterium]|nr:phage major capsid protein [Clostridia bacterium]
MLKQIKLRKQIENLRSELTGAQETRSALEERRSALKLREEELEKAIGEVNAETPAEDQKMLDEETEKWEEEDAALSKEEEENLETTRKLQEQIDSLQQELDELDSRSKRAAQPPANTDRDERKVENTMNTRKFFGMNIQERDAFFARSDVKEFIANTRTIIKEKRNISGEDLLIPVVVLDLIRERAGEYSKLLKHVNVQRIKGNSRVTVMGVVPEAIWTEMCAKLNEIDLSFGAVEMDGFKVGAFISVCNAVLEDNDVGLAEKIIEALGKAMGKAIDKAILFGSGRKMPTGILTALEASEEYADTNIVTVNGKTGIDLFKAIIAASGETDNDYATGGMFWAMNQKTKTKLITEAMGFSAAGAIVTGQSGEMPIVGGKIETIGDIPDDMIIAGYGELYPMVERAEMKFGRSEEVRFIEDQTVFKGTARYDGKPAIEKAFIAISLTATKPTVAGINFAPDLANG